jgi:hypothetical protein
MSTACHALHIQEISLVFDRDESNLRKIKAHGIDAAEVEQALSADPILIYEQDAEGEKAVGGGADGA